MSTIKFEIRDSDHFFYVKSVGDIPVILIY